VVRGYAATEASLAMTLEFSKLPFAMGIAYLAFGEVIDAWTWIGTVIIFACAVYITRREARLRAQRASQLSSLVSTQGRGKAGTREVLREWRLLEPAAHERAPGGPRAIL
jgi:hypothetical protein